MSVGDMVGRPARSWTMKSQLDTTRGRKTSLRARQGFERYTHNYQLAGAYGNDALGSEAFREARYP